MRVWAEQTAKAQAAGAQAYARLLRQAEEGSSGQSAGIARFIAAAYNGTAFPLDVPLPTAQPAATRTGASRLATTARATSTGRQRLGAVCLEGPPAGPRNLPR